MPGARQSSTCKPMVRSNSLTTAIADGGKRSQCLMCLVACLIGLVQLNRASLQAEEKSLAEQMPRIPSKSVKEAPSTFKLQHGFTLQIVASEPQTLDPIDAAFDEHGRMYVVEMNDYPFLPDQRVQKYLDQRAETWGQIRLMTDTDGDGRIDQSTVFADKIRWPQSVCCAKGGVYVITPPYLYFMKDTDGDGVADIKEVICSGFNTSNVQGLSNSLEWGRDNAIYFSSGMAGGELTIPARNGQPEKKFTPGRRDIRLDPATNEMTLVAGGQQYGHAIDDWGDRFICNNSNHIIHVTWPLKYLERNPLLSIPDMTRSIAKEGAAAVVFRTSGPEPWRLVRTARRAADPEMRKRLPHTELFATGFFTSATGITVYRGSVYPPEFQGNVFIGDVGANLVHRKLLSPSGISYVAERADENVEFLTSTDNWFRPVNFVNAPDGTLYVLDMYRETIEHPFSIPDDIKALVDLESGYDKGRIWRLTAPNSQRIPPPDLGKGTSIELVNQLASPNGWNRDTAQRLIVERNDQSAVVPLHELLKAKTADTSNLSAKVRLHILYTLLGLKGLNADDIRLALVDANPHLREHALKLAIPFTQSNPELVPVILSLVNDSDVRVRWQLAFTLGDLPPDAAVAGLRQLAVPAANDGDLRVAWLSSCYSHMGALAQELLNGETGTITPLLTDLARLIGSQPEPKDALRLLEGLSKSSLPDSTRIPVLLSLGDGLRRRGTTIERIIGEAQPNRMIADSLNAVYQRAAELVKSVTAAPAERLAAIQLMGLAPATMAQSALAELLNPQTAPELQQAVIKSLSAHGTPDILQSMISNWKSLGPGTRREVVDSLVQSKDGAMAILSAIEAGSIKPGEIERDKRQLLMNHPQGTVKERAKTILAEAPSNRKQVVADYQTALELSGDVERGRMLLSKTCFQCHRAGSNGFQVGPDLVSVQNKSPTDLLTAILDPNREAQPQYQTYTAVTNQGKVHTGIISSETAASLTLKRAEAKEDVVLRDTLEELISNGTSLMPEGLEKEINPQQLADLIAAIKAIQ